MGKALLCATVRTKQGRFVLSVEREYDFGFEAWRDQPKVASIAQRKAEEDTNLKKILEEYEDDSLKGGTIETAVTIGGEENDRRVWKI